jgi:two-component system, cell cycle response regulator
VSAGRPTSTSTPPAPSARSLPPSRRRRHAGLELRGDAFDDHRPLAPKKQRRAISAEVWLGALCLVGAAAIAVVHEAAIVVCLGVAVVLGAVVPRPARLTCAAAIGSAVAMAIAAGATSSATSIGAWLVPAVGAAVGVVAFAWLPRAVVRGTIESAQRAERERADREVLKLLDDARRLRALGGHVDGDVDPVNRDVACAVTQRDRLYRLLSLIERGLDGVASVALYGLDERGAALHLIEQRIVVSDDVDGKADARVEPEADNHERVTLATRGVGPAGVVGLSVQRKVPLRVVDAEGAAVAAHRRCGRRPQSVLCVPILGPRESVTGVIVVDRVEPIPFSAADEAFVRAAATEVKDGLAMEALIDALDGERRRVSRIFAAARSLAGAARRADVDRLTLAAAREVVAGAAIVDTLVSDAFVVASADGLLAPLQGAKGTLSTTSFGARCLVEGAPLPHVSLEKATARPLLSVDDAVTVSELGDVRAIPLAVGGDGAGVLLVATRPGERMRSDVVDALVALADVAALALASARAFDAVEKRATTDALTGVFNRRSLDEKLSEAVARSRRSGAPLCVMITDVDHFKSVNDTWGHGVGDEVLKAVASTLQQRARGTDVVARLGGEEFVVVCEATDLEGAAVVAERMRVALKSMQLTTPKGPLSITSSFGVALLLADDIDGHATLEAADKNLYRAKQQGRDRVVAG